MITNNNIFYMQNFNYKNGKLFYLLNHFLVNIILYHVLTDHIFVSNCKKINKKILIKKNNYLLSY